AACRLGELVGAGILDEHGAAGVLHHAASVHIGIEGFTADEADRAIANGLARGRENPRQIHPHQSDPPGGPGRRP
ncbi:MAG TPA: hypothetical protein VFX70_06890, partial [Mycobacteriales bacterium]|nr:hypothetical protein [Mycobacteriales bacterium]